MFHKEQLISIYADGARGQYPQLSVTTFDGLADALSRRVYFEHDDPANPGKTPLECPAFTPAEFDGKGRFANNVVRVHFGVIDCDGAAPDRFERLVNNTLLPLRKVVYSTFSHGRKTGVRARIVFPLSRPVLATEWPAFWRGLQEIVGADVIDRSTKNPDRLYFWPATRVGFEPFFFDTPGQELDADSTIAIGLKHGATRTYSSADEEATEDDEKKTVLTIDDLRELAAVLKRKSSPALKGIGRTLTLVCDKEVYCKDRERDLVLFKIAGQIAAAYPSADPHTTAQLFIPSLVATNRYHSDGDADKDVEKIEDKLKRQQLKRQEEIAQLRAEDDARHAELILEAWLGLGVARETPYTSEEIATFREDLGLPREIKPGQGPLGRRWILQHGTSYYVFVGGEYTNPLPEKSAINSVHRDLSPAITAGVELTKTTANGSEITKSLNELVVEYGTVARRTVVNFAAQETSYDPRTQTITEAPCPIRKDLTPMYDVRLEPWLFHLAGGNDADYDKLCNFLAFLTRLEDPCVALYLDGAPGAGKSLFAWAASRLYGNAGPTPMDNAIDKFNDSMLRNPIIFANEQLPKELGENGTRFLRKFQDDQNTRVSTKYMPDRDRVGYIRLILAANSVNIISADKMMNDNDIAAMNERFLYLKAHPDTASVLESTFGASVSEIVTKDILARHALALAEQRRGVPKTTRFLIETSHDSDLTRALTTNTGSRAAICHWLVLYLQNPRPVDAQGKYFVFITERKLLVNPQALVDFWELYTTNVKVSSTSAIAQSLTSLSRGRTSRNFGPNGAPIEYFEFDVHNLYYWSQHTGISNQAEIDKALTRTTIWRPRLVDQLPPDQREKLTGKI